MSRAISYFLFARPSFWSGFGQLLDFGDTRTEYNDSGDPELADYFAIKADWHATGGDFRMVMSKELPTKRLGG